MLRKGKNCYPVTAVFHLIQICLFVCVVGKPGLRTENLPVWMSHWCASQCWQITLVYCWSLSYFALIFTTSILQLQLRLLKGRWCRMMDKIHLCLTVKTLSQIIQTGWPAGWLAGGPVGWRGCESGRDPEKEGGWERCLCSPCRVPDPCPGLEGLQPASLQAYSHICSLSAALAMNLLPCLFAWCFNCI